MDTMQFRGYVMRYNPQSIRVTGGERLVSHLCPGRGEVVQSLGAGVRIVTCKGAFYGSSYADALAQLEGFRAASAGGRAGVLFLPGLEPLTCHLRELAFEAEGDGCVIPYTMAFQEEKA